MPKRPRSEENEAPSNIPAEDIKRFTTNVVNKAYGEVNKLGETIPHDKIIRPVFSAKELPNQLRVAAWNLNGLRAFIQKRSELLRKLWEAEQLDVLGITETKITEKEKCDEVEKEIKKTLKGVVDVHCIWNMCSVKKGYSGSLAIVRKSVYDKCLSAKFGFNGSADQEGRVITLEFKSTAVVIAYVPNSGQNLERLSYRATSWDKQLAGHCIELNKSKPHGVILAGDLNVAHRDVDIWNVDAAHIPKSAGTTPQERASFEKQYLDKGLVDTFASVHGDKLGWFTYWSVRARNKPRNRGLRLDYVLVDPKKVNLLDAYIGPEYAADGDHCPVGVVVSVKKDEL